MWSEKIIFKFLSFTYSNFSKVLINSELDRHRFLLIPILIRNPSWIRALFCPTFRHNSTRHATIHPCMFFICSGGWQRKTDSHYSMLMLDLNINQNFCHIVKIRGSLNLIFSEYFLNNYFISGQYQVKSYPIRYTHRINLVGKTIVHLIK